MLRGNKGRFKLLVQVWNLFIAKSYWLHRKPVLIQDAAVEPKINEVFASFRLKICLWKAESGVEYLIVSLCPHSDCEDACGYLLATSKSFVLVVLADQSSSLVTVHSGLGALEMWSIFGSLALLGSFFAAVHAQTITTTDLYALFASLLPAG